jgi:hypothetical protein
MCNQRNVQFQSITNSNHTEYDPAVLNLSQNSSASTHNFKERLMRPVKSQFPKRAHASDLARFRVLIRVREFLQTDSFGS